METVTNGTDSLEKLGQSKKYCDGDILAKSLPPLSPNIEEFNGFFINQTKTWTTTPTEYSMMSKSFEKHGQKLLDYLMARENVSVERWRPVLWPLVQEIAFTVQADVKKRKDNMDILRYVHVKTIRCSDDKPNAKVFFGTVCTKTVTDNRMKQSFINPYVFIVNGSIEYEQDEGKFCSIDPIIAQETEHLKNIVQKIASRKPDIVLVEKSVARVAQHFFRKAGISLVCNLKQSVLRRIARCTQADIVQSIDSQIAKSKLGTCGAVRCELIPVTNSAIVNSGAGLKTLLCFEDCPPDLGCAIVLMGSHSIELRRIKKLVKFMIALLYSSKLEMDMLQTCRVRLTAPISSLDEYQNEELLGLSCDTCRSNRDLLPRYNMPSETDENLPDVENLDQRRQFVNGVKNATFYNSPFIQITLPHLETIKGAKCKLRSQFNLDQLYRCGSNSKLPMSDDNVFPAADRLRKMSLREELLREDVSSTETELDFDPFIHPFVLDKVTKSADSYEQKRDLAKYRAEGLKYFRRLRAAMEKHPLASGTSSVKCMTPELSVDEEGIDPVLDVLDPFAHQRIAVLYSSYSPSSENAPGFCLKPKVFVLHYYGRFDVTLGEYLERFCFSPLYKCTNELCDGYMVGHIRKLVHGNSCVEITVQNIDVPADSGRSNVAANDAENPSDLILAWDWCSRCKATTSANSLSKEAWHLSFAKYLDYLFNSRRLTSHLVNDTICNCCLLHQHVHYFAHKNSVTSFKVTKINLYDICFPELSCFIVAKKLSATSFVQKMKYVSDKSMETFSLASDLLTSMKSVLLDQNNKSNVSWSTYLQELQNVLDDSQNTFREMMNVAHSILAEIDESGELMSNDERVNVFTEKLTRSKYCVAAMVQKWNGVINELVVASKKKVDALTVVKSGSTGDDTCPPVDSPISGQMNSSGASSNNLSADESSPIKPPNTTSAADSSNLLNDRKSLTKMLTSSVLSILYDPSEHYTLPVSPSIAVVARDTEIASIVAYALSTDEYERTRKSMLDGWSQEGVPFTLKSSGFQSATNAFNQSADSSTTTAAVPQHIELQFADGTTKFYCKIYYAEHFRLLRKLLFPDGEQAFVRSLSRCEPWAPKGGKSGAVFNRTSDKRFVLKQMSRFEQQSFIKFAPNYFNHLSTVHAENKLTALAKIFGVFRVGINNEAKMDFMVLEYLFYNRNVSQVYDLKGSLRNRLAANTSTEKRRHADDDLVLLDENLLRRICTNSFYCFPHSKAALKVAISNDSYFLASNMVMDYSLLCGVDEDKNELVLGIIDYMRTYTWDKKVESLIKSVSVTGQLPTVISPELYRDRFVEVMDTYFPVAPDQWTGLGYGVSG